MSLAFKKLKVYTRVALFVVVAVAIAAVLFKNRGHSVQVWFFGLVDADQEVNVVWLMLWTAVGAVVSWWVLKTTLSLVKDARALRREAEFRRREQAQRELAAKIAEQERRIDQKIHQAIAEDVDSGE